MGFLGQLVLCTDFREEKRSRLCEAAVAKMDLSRAGVLPCAMLRPQVGGDAGAG